MVVVVMVVIVMVVVAIGSSRRSITRMMMGVSIFLAHKPSFSSRSYSLFLGSCCISHHFLSACLHLRSVLAYEHDLLVQFGFFPHVSVFFLCRGRRGRSWWSGRRRRRRKGRNGSRGSSWNGDRRKGRGHWSRGRSGSEHRGSVGFLRIEVVFSLLLVALASLFVFLVVVASLLSGWCRLNRSLYVIFLS